jgi:TPR repeat protein
MLAKGEGCEPDRIAARSWFQKAAQQGLTVAQKALREFDQTGRDVQTDRN